MLRGVEAPRPHDQPATSSNSEPKNVTPIIRTGIISGGNWIIDHVKRLDSWPPQDGLAHIVGRTAGNGGGPYNVLKDLAKLGAPFPLEAVGLLGDDADGRAASNSGSAPPRPRSAMARAPMRFSRSTSASSWADGTGFSLDNVALDHGPGLETLAGV
jgi:hypothetical protein